MFPPEQKIMRHCGDKKFKYDSSTCLYSPAVKIYKKLMFLIILRLYKWGSTQNSVCSSPSVICPSHCAADTTGKSLINFIYRIFLNRGIYQNHFFPTPYPEKFFFPNFVGSYDDRFLPYFHHLFAFSPRPFPPFFSPFSPFFLLFSIFSAPFPVSFSSFFPPNVFI